MITASTKSEILRLLGKKPHHSGLLAALLDVKQAGICRHLKELKEMGKVENVERGLWALPQRSRTSSEELRTHMFDDLLDRLQTMHNRSAVAEDRATLTEASCWIRTLRDRDPAAAK